MNKEENTPTLEEVRETIAKIFGYIEIEEGYADSGERQYGASDDSLIDTVYNILTNNN